MRSLQPPIQQATDSGGSSRPCVPASLVLHQDQVQAHLDWAILVTLLRSAAEPAALAAVDLTVGSGGVQQLYQACVL